MSQGFYGNSGRNRYQKPQKFQQRSQYPSNYYDNYYDDSTYYQKTDYQNKKYSDYNNNNNKNKNRPRNNVNSQLIKAVKDNDIPSVKECIRNGANVDSVDFKDYEKRNALTWAVIGGNLEIIELLLQNGAQWSHCSHGMKTGRTAMHFGVRFNKIESINKMYQLLSNEERLLLIEYPTLKYQWTPLHLACYYKQYESCLWLLEHGANVFCATENGELPIDFAKKQTYNRKTNEVFKVSKKLIKLIEKYQNKVINNGDTTNNKNNNNGESGECGEIGESNVIIDGLDGNDPGSIINKKNNNNNNNNNNSNPNAKKKMEFENKDEEKEKELLTNHNNNNNNNNINIGNGDNDDTPGGLLIGCNDNENDNDNNNDNSDNSSSFHNNNDNIIYNNNTMMGFEDGNNNNDVLNEGSLLNERNEKNENNVMNDRTRHYYIDDINILRQMIDQMWKSNDQLQQRIDFLKAKNQHVQDNVSNNKLYKE